MIERSQVRAPASPGSTSCADSYFGIHVKDPGHSAIRAGGRLQLNTHASYICSFEWSDTANWCMAYTEPAPKLQQSHVALAM